MEKQADARVNQWILSGVLGGVSAASVAALLRKVRHMKDIKETYGGSGTDEDAIVVTLPRRGKTAEDLKVKAVGESPQAPEPGKVKALDAESGPGSVVDSGKDIEAVSSRGQQRRTDGTYGVKYADGEGEDRPGWLARTGRAVDRAVAALIGDPEAGKPPFLLSPVLPKPKQELSDWQRILFGALGLGVGGYGAYKVVDSIHRKRRLRQLERELEAAKSHYVSRMYGEPGEKRGFKPGATDVVLALVALKAMALTGGTAYLTKRWLDEREREKRDVGLDIPSAPRIVFRTEPGSSGKEAESLVEITDLEADTVKAAMGFYVDLLGERKIVGSEAFAKTAEDAGTTVEALVKLAAEPGALSPELIAAIQKHGPELAGVLPRLPGAAGWWQWAQQSRIPVVGSIARWLTGGAMRRRLSDPGYVQSMRERLDPRTWRAQAMEQARQYMGRGRSAVDDYVGRLAAGAGYDVQRQRAAAAANAEASATPAAEVPDPSPFPQ